MSQDTHAEPKTHPDQGLLFRFNRFKKFNTKFMLATGATVLIGAVLNVLVARQGIHKLSAESSREIEAGLNVATREYLTNHISDKALHTNNTLGHAYSDLQIVTDVVQRMVDNDESLQPLYERVGTMPFFRRNIEYHPKSNWYQNTEKKPPETPDPTVISVWGYLGDKGVIRTDVQKAINGTGLLDIFLPSFKEHGADKLQIYYVGPKEMPYARFAPYADLGTTLDGMMADHNTKNWYDAFYGGLVEGWQGWLKEPDGLKKRPNQVTVSAPYTDAAGGGMIITAFGPLWSKDRKGFAGILGLDLTLDQVIATVKDVKLAQTGFAFLAQADTNVLAVNEAGAKTLGLPSFPSGEKGKVFEFVQRYLKKSSESPVASLVLPTNDAIDYHDITIGGEEHIIVLKRLQELNSFAPETGITKEYWTLGFVVPKSEIYASLLAAQAAIEKTRTDLVTTQVGIAAGSFLLLMLGVYLVSRRMTGALVALSASATRLRKGDYSVRVEPSSEDEIGQLSVAFNDMASEIQAYTTNLEELVRARTKALEDANQEISELNAKLAQENLRLGAELNVARQLQLMVLPSEKELRAMPSLDIAGYMAPADEVGGDYYDVLSNGNGGMVKIGIGDVTGHGLESGVLMLMVQTAVRTLLASNEKDPCRFLNIVNKVVYQNAQRINSEKNLTLSLMDYEDGVLRLTGQHEEVIIVRHDGTLERVDTTGFGLPVGLDDDIMDALSCVDLKLDPGDVVTLFTDGVTEAEDVTQEQYGIERLCDVIVQNHTRKSEQIKDSIINDVMSHIGDNKIYDDITVLVIKRL